MKLQSDMRQEDKQTPALVEAHVISRTFIWKQWQSIDILFLKGTKIKNNTNEKDTFV